MDTTVFGANILDILIIAVFLFYVFEGFEVGFITASLDLCSFIFSFLIGLKTYSLFGYLLATHVGISVGFANAVGFFIAAFIAEVLITFVMGRIFHRFSILSGKIYSLFGGQVQEEKPQVGRAGVNTLNHVLGIIPGFLSAWVLLIFLCSIILALPLSPFLKQTIESSRFGNAFVLSGQGIENSVNRVFGGAITETLNFLTVKTEGSESISLGFTVPNGKVDEKAEEEMLLLINKEREKEGLSPVVMDSALISVARAHAKDMLGRGYFSHDTPEGVTTFDRLTKANIPYLAAGENLAFAPNTQIAMQGLLQSRGHRANIVGKDFTKVGIGVIDAGIYGEMFVQEFTN